MGTTALIVIIVVVVIVVLLLALFFASRRRAAQRSEEQRERSREEFGSEYERTAQERGSEEEAERVLRERRGRVERRVEPLSEASRGRYGVPRSAGVKTYERPHKERGSPDEPPEPCSQRLHVAPSAASLFSHEPLVDRAILADGLTQLFGGLLVRVFLLRTPCRTGHDVGSDAPRLPVVVGDLWVHGGQVPLGLLVGLACVGDEVALVQDVGDGPVRHLYGPLRIVYKDPLDLSPLLFIATAARF